VARGIAIPNHEGLTVADELVTNFFCHSQVMRELHSDQGRNSEHRLLQEMLQHLSKGDMWITPLHPQSNSMVEQYTKMAEEHLQKVVSTHQEDWDKRRPSSC
jgi:hypothetical protein